MDNFSQKNVKLLMESMDFNGIVETVDSLIIYEKYKVIFHIINRLRSLSPRIILEDMSGSAALKLLRKEIEAMLVFIKD